MVSFAISRSTSIILMALCAAGKAQQYQQTTTAQPQPQPQPQPHPYTFAYTAGRYPGQVDRTRVEYGDANGVVRGLYTYVDPKEEIRAVEYVADKNGFHPVLNIPPAIDTPAVAAAKSKHLKLFNRIAENNRIAVPQDTLSVARAKQNHALLFARISEDHARIAAQLEAERVKTERAAQLYRRQNEGA